MTEENASGAFEVVRPKQRCIDSTAADSRKGRQDLRRRNPLSFDGSGISCSVSWEALVLHLIRRLYEGNSSADVDAVRNRDSIVRAIGVTLRRKCGDWGLLPDAEEGRGPSRGFCHRQVRQH